MSATDHRWSIGKIKPLCTCPHALASPRTALPPAAPASDGRAQEAEAIGSIFRHYVERKRAQNVLDYDDLLLYWSALMQAPAGARVSRLFEHVLVDEYQDTSAMQADILEGAVEGMSWAGREDR